MTRIELVTAFLLSQQRFTAATLTKGVLYQLSYIGSKPAAINLAQWLRAG
jgi:hypothetical protein